MFIYEITWELKIYGSNKKYNFNIAQIKIINFILI